MENSAAGNQWGSAPIACPPSLLALRLLTELHKYLDTLTITGDNIGDIRRQCFMPWDSEWNGIVRDETAQREQAAPVVSSQDDLEALALLRTALQRQIAQTALGQSEGFRMVTTPRAEGDASTTAPEEDDPEWDAFMRRTGRFMDAGGRR